MTGWRFQTIPAFVTAYCLRNRATAAPLLGSLRHSNRFAATLLLATLNNTNVDSSDADKVVAPAPAQTPPCRKEALLSQWRRQIHDDTPQQYYADTIALLRCADLGPADIVSILEHIVSAPMDDDGAGGADYQAFLVAEVLRLHPLPPPTRLLRDYLGRPHGSAIALSVMRNTHNVRCCPHLLPHVWAIVETAMAAAANKRRQMMMHQNVFGAAPAVAAHADAWYAEEIDQFWLTAAGQMRYPSVRGFFMRAGVVPQCTATLDFANAIMQSGDGDDDDDVLMQIARDHIQCADAGGGPDAAVEEEEKEDEEDEDDEDKVDGGRHAAYRLLLHWTEAAARHGRAKILRELLRQQRQRVRVARISADAADAGAMRLVDQCVAHGRADCLRLVVLGHHRAHADTAALRRRAIAVACRQSDQNQEISLRALAPFTRKESAATAAAVPVPSSASSVGWIAYPFSREQLADDDDDDDEEKERQRPQMLLLPAVKYAWAWAVRSIVGDSR